MGRTFKQLWRLVLCASLIVGTLSAVGSVAVGQDKPAPRVETGVPGTDLLSSAVTYKKAWSESIELIRGGRLEQARLRIDEIAREGTNAERIAGWLEDWISEEENRNVLTNADYEKYETRAKKWQGKDKLVKACEWAYAAMLNASDEDSFRKQDWLLELKNATMEEAAELRQNHEWRDAHTRYYDLSLIFEKDKEVDRLRKECLEHARLDEIYKEDRDWQDSLEGIVVDTVEEVFYHVGRKYVVDADFKEATIAGYRELLLIAESPALRSQFSGLEGERGEHFVARVEKRLEQIKAEKSLTDRTALEYFRRALKINRETAQVDEAVIVREYLNASLETLDEFTSVIWPQEYREFEKHTRGDFVGVGIQIRNKYNTDIKENEIMVVSPLPDTPAYRAGIRRNDIITHVNDKPLLGVPLNKAVTMITGPIGSTVTLKVRRQLDSGKDAALDFALQRDTVKIRSVKGAQRRTDDEQLWDYMADPAMGIAYVRVESFQDNTVSDLRKALADAKAHGMRGLVLDLRFNPGGLLRSAVEMAELFVQRHDRIVSTKGLRSAEWGVDATQDGEYEDLPLIVLVNEYSASASEIVAGAIKDHKRGTIIGERSFGKFSVQNLIPLIRSGDSHLKLTTARYYLPSGRSLHREEDSTVWGVEPDMVVDLVPKELNKILTMQRNADVIGAVKPSDDEDLANEPVKPDEDEDKAQDDVAGDEAKIVDDGAADDEKASSDDAEEIEDDPDENDRPERDPQLEMALLVMRVHLLDAEAPQVAKSSAAPTESSVKE